MNKTKKSKMIKKLNKNKPIAAVVLGLLIISIAGAHFTGVFDITTAGTIEEKILIPLMGRIECHSIGSAGRTYTTTYTTDANLQTTIRFGRKNMRANRYKITSHKSGKFS